MLFDRATSEPIKAERAMNGVLQSELSVIRGLIGVRRMPCLVKGMQCLESLSGSERAIIYPKGHALILVGRPLGKGFNFLKSGSGLVIESGLRLTPLQS